MSGLPDTRRPLTLSSGETWIYSLPELEKAGLVDLARLPFCVRILLENALRHSKHGAAEKDVMLLAGWRPDAGATGEGGAEGEISFHPSRVLMQDLTGLPCLIDLAALRQAAARRDLDPRRIDPLVPVDLVIDHSIHMDFAGSPDALVRNMDLEFRRNRERYEFFRWAQQAFGNLRVVPPGAGIVHQVNLEYLAPVVQMRRAADGRMEAFPDTVVGTDSHTTMINGLGVLGWGVGGIEAEAAMLGLPLTLLPPRVVGVRLIGTLHERSTATDAVLTLTRLLRSVGVVDCFVEFFGSAVEDLAVPDRATLANMAPEYGATSGYFPVDARTVSYLLQSGRNASHVADVERYLREQGLFKELQEGPEYSRVVEFDLREVEPAVAGPSRPQDLVLLGRADQSLDSMLPGRDSQRQSPAGSVGKRPPAGSAAQAERAVSLEPQPVDDGAVVVAAITSCTNTSNPAGMLAAGLLARNAQRRGLRPPAWVKTSLSPGSRVVTEYLRRTGLLEHLEALGFHVAGYGCATCIGNTGDLEPEAEQAIRERDLLAVAVLSGNRNFEGRIHPLVKANYLASPPLVVAYALAGNFRVNLLTSPLGFDAEGDPVYLRDVWPDPREVDSLLPATRGSDLFEEAYTEVMSGDERWRSLVSDEGALFEWDPDSTYVREPPFLSTQAPGLGGRARILALLGDSVTTDHISPAGSIPFDSPAGRYLRDRWVEPAGFNSYGARRGNHEVMMRGTFANIRVRNLAVPGMEGGWARHYPSGEVVSIFEAAERYRAEGTPLVVVAGREYGSGSSRDWAAKGPALLGVVAVIAESFERIHRSNLVGMGILPLQFRVGESAAQWGLRGDEILQFGFETADLQPKAEVEVAVTRGDTGVVERHLALVRLDSAADLATYRMGGIIPGMLEHFRSVGERK